MFFANLRLCLSLCPSLCLYPALCTPASGCTRCSVLQFLAVVNGFTYWWNGKQSAPLCIHEFLISYVYGKRVLNVNEIYCTWCYTSKHSSIPQFGPRPRSK